MNELYTITQLNPTATGVSAKVILNPAHPLFPGHFPGQPVLPGVCMMELIGDVAGRKIGKVFRVTGGPLLKFLNMVDPRHHPELELDMTLQESGDRCSAEGKLFQGSLVFLKFRLELSLMP